MNKIYNTIRAWNLVTAEVQEKYVGKNVTFLHNKGRVVEFNDFGVLINWTTIDPVGHCVDEIIYPNILGTLVQLTLEDEDV